MKILNNKFVVIICFALFIVSGAMLFLKLHNLLVGIPENSNNYISYLLFAIILISGIILFAMSITRKTEILKIKEEVIIENNDKIENDDQNSTSQKIEKSDLDIEKLSSAVIPPDDLINSTEHYCEKLLINLSKELEIVQGVVFLLDKKEELYQPVAKYAYFNDEPPKAFKAGETLSGQVARNKNFIIVDDIPEGYIKVVSGLGTSSPKHLLIFPVLNDDKVIGILELASFRSFDKNINNLVNRLSEKLNVPFTTLTKE